VHARAGGREHARACAGMRGRARACVRVLLDFSFNKIRIIDIMRTIDKTVDKYYGYIQV
jgi:hypothetical protein